MRIYFIPRYLTIIGEGGQIFLVFFTQRYVKHCVLACRTDWSISYKPVRFLIYIFVLFWLAHWHCSLFKNMIAAELLAGEKKYFVAVFFFLSCFILSFRGIRFIRPYITIEFESCQKRNGSLRQGFFLNKKTDRWWTCSRFLCEIALFKIEMFLAVDFLSFLQIFNEKWIFINVMHK